MSDTAFKWAALLIFAFLAYSYIQQLDGGGNGPSPPPPDQTWKPYIDRLGLTAEHRAILGALLAATADAVERDGALGEDARLGATSDLVDVLRAVLQYELLRTYDMDSLWIAVGKEINPTEESLPLDTDTRTRAAVVLRAVAEAC